MANLAGAGARLRSGRNPSFAQFLLNPGLCGIEESDGEGGIVNAEAAVVQDQVKIEARFLDVAGNERLFAGGWARTARGEITGIGVFPGPGSVLGAQGIGRLGDGPQIQARFDGVDLVGDGGGSKLNQFLRQGMTFQTDVEGLHFEFMAGNSGPAGADVVSALHVTTGALVFD